MDCAFDFFACPSICNVGICNPVAGPACDCNYDVTNDSCSVSFENKYTCPSDCNQPREQFSAPIDGTSGQAGNLFDIEAVKEIQILGFDIRIQGGVTNFTAEVYTKAGTYVGFESNAAAWTLIQRATGVRNTGGALTPLPLLPNPIVIPAGAKQSFYVTITVNGLLYTNIAPQTEGSVFDEDSNLKLLIGKGVSYPFGTGAPAPGFWAPRLWNGNINYLVVPKLLDLITTTAGGSGAAGAMFDIVASKDIQIAGFEIRIFSGTSAQVYTKEGTYKGFEANAAAWGGPIQDATGIVSNGGANLTPLPLLDPSNPIIIPAGARRAFYVAMTGNGILYYTGGSAVQGLSEGQVFNANSDLEFYIGVGRSAGQFNPDPQTLWNPRIWNGKIRYEVITPATSTSEQGFDSTGQQPDSGTFEPLEDYGVVPP